MKKKYEKPTFYKEALNLHSTSVRTCGDAGDFWDQTPMYGVNPDGSVDSVIVFVPDLACDMTPHEFMDQYGGTDAFCLYASTDDKVTFNS